MNEIQHPPESTNPSPTSTLPSTPSPHDGLPAPAPPRPPTCSKEANRYKTPASGEQDNTAYRRAEKQYRRQRVAVNRRRTRYVRQDPDLGEAVDFAREGVEDDPRVRLVAVLGDGRRIYALRDRPGFYYVRGALDWREQARWARCCLKEFSRSPFTNITNNHADARMNDAEDDKEEISSSSSLWERAVRTVKEEGGGEGGLSQAVQDMHVLRWANVGLNYIWTTRQYAAAAAKGRDGDHEEEGGGGEGVKEEGEGEAFAQEDGQEEQDGREEGKGVRIHDARQDEDASTRDSQHQSSTLQASFPVPAALTQLARDILSLAARADNHDFEEKEETSSSAAAAGAAAVPRPAGAVVFQAEAGIVNYYPPESSMGGHIDDAEGALEVPLVSFSLGLGSVFLLGGRSKEVDPVPIVFRSGDCMVMGKEARVCFHGVPCVLMESARPDDRLVDWTMLSSVVGGGEGGKEEGKEEGQGCGESEARLLAHYLASSRINFNVRQVWRRRGGERRASTTTTTAAAAHQ